MHLFVKTLKKVITVDVTNSDLISMVKSLIQVKERIPVDQQVLCLSGRVLENAQTIAFYGIQNNSTLHLHYPRPPSFYGNMQIFIKVDNKKTIALDVDNLETIETVKSRIQEKEGIQSNQGKLAFEETWLNESRTLASYRIQKDATLEFQLRKRCETTIFIKTLTGKTISLRSDLSGTVEKLKEQIMVKEGIPLKEQFLIFAAKPMANGLLLSEYNIAWESTLHLVVRMPGGMDIFEKDSWPAICGIMGPV